MSRTKPAASSSPPYRIHTAAASDCAYDHKRLGTIRNRLRQLRIRRFMREVLLAGEETDEGPALFCNVVANRAAQHRVSILQRIEYGSLRDRAVNVKLHFPAHTSQRPQMRRKHNPDHLSVCTSTESTAGRSLTIGVHVSPESGDAYTCPPVVPK